MNIKHCKMRPGLVSILFFVSIYINPEKSCSHKYVNENELCSNNVTQWFDSLQSYMPKMKYWSNIKKSSSNQKLNFVNSRIRINLTCINHSFLLFLEDTKGFTKTYRRLTLSLTGTLFNPIYLELGKLKY